MTVRGHPRSVVEVCETEETRKNLEKLSTLFRQMIMPPVLNESMNSARQTTTSTVALRKLDALGSMMCTTGSAGAAASDDGALLGPLCSGPAGLGVWNDLPFSTESDMAVMGERANGRLKKNRRDALGFLCSRRWCSPSKRRLSQPATDTSHCSKLLAWSALFPQNRVCPCYHLRSKRP